MLHDLVLADEMALFMLASMYFGTGWSTVLFSFPIVSKLTVDNYYLHFVPQVKAAVRVFTVVTTLLLGTAGVMLLYEWGTGLAWVPVVIAALVIASTALTLTQIMPVNRRMAEGITDAGELGRSVRKWVRLTSIRVALWTGEWILMAIFFAVRARR